MSVGRCGVAQQTGRRRWSARTRAQVNNAPARPVQPVLRLPKPTDHRPPGRGRYEVPRLVLFDCAAVQAYSLNLQQQQISAYIDSSLRQACSLCWVHNHDLAPAQPKAICVYTHPPSLDVLSPAYPTYGHTHSPSLPLSHTLTHTHQD